MRFPKLSRQATTYPRPFPRRDIGNVKPTSVPRGWDHIEADRPDRLAKLASEYDRQEATDRATTIVLAVVLFAVGLAYTLCQ